MKKITALVLALIMALGLTFGFADCAAAAYIDLSEIYSEYGLGQTIFVQGETDLGLLMVYLLNPDDSSRLTVTITRSELMEGMEINIGDDWDLGPYTLRVGYGSVIVNEYHFDIVKDPVKHTPTKPGNTGSNSNRVVATSITISPASIELQVGESAEIQVVSAGSGVTWETDNGDMIKISGTTTATVTAVKTGTATAWAYSGNNYATLRVKIVPAEHKPEQDVPQQKPVEPVKPDAFSDLGSVEWAKEGINALAEAGVINGMGDGTFAPDRGVTRAEFVKMIVEAFGFEGAGDAAFDDISGDEWYAGVVLVAANNGIVNGYAGKFSPNNNISCQDAALILSRVAQMKGIKLDQPSAQESEAVEYARGAVAQLKGNGVITPEMGFSATENATRAQSAFMIYNIYKQR